MPFPQSEIAKQRFDQIEHIGHGAFGEVYCAIDKRLRRPVAIKEISGTLDLGDRRAARQRFLHESQIVAQINSPHVVTVYGFEEDSQQGEQYLYLEYLSHGTLAELLQKQGRLSEREAAIVARDIARAIQAHWARDIVHRDIKPSNVLIVAKQQNQLAGAKLSDYGIAQDMGTTYRSSTSGQAHPGTPAYMSPEQATSQAALTAASDLYNIGLLLWDMLTGTGRHKQPGAPITSDALHGSPRMAQIVARLLELHVSDRYQDPAELIRDLDTIIASPRPLPTVKTPKIMPPYLQVRRWLLALVPVLLLLLAGGAYAYAIFDGRGAAGVSITGAASEPVVDAMIDSPTPETLPEPPTEIPPESTLTNTLEPTPTETLEPTPTETLEPTLTSIPELTPTNSPEPSLTSTIPDSDAIVIASELNVRSGPSTRYPRIASYFNGTQLQVRGKDIEGAWFQVEGPDGKIGWMSSSGLMVLVKVADISVIAAPPEPTRAPVATEKPQPTPNQAPQPVEPTTPQPATEYDGHWNGTTSQGLPFGFQVNALGGAGLSYIRSPGCEPDGFAGSYSAQITGSQIYIEFGGGWAEARGSFTSSNSASGTF